MEVPFQKYIGPNTHWIWKEKKTNALPTQVGEERKVMMQLLNKQLKDIYSKCNNLVPKEVVNADDPDQQRHDEETIKEITKEMSSPEEIFKQQIN